MLTLTRPRCIDVRKLAYLFVSDSHHPVIQAKQDKNKREHCHHSVDKGIGRIGESVITRDVFVNEQSMGPKAHKDTTEHDNEDKGNTEKDHPYIV